MPHVQYDLTSATTAEVVVVNCFVKNGTERESSVSVFCRQWCRTVWSRRGEERETRNYLSAVVMMVAAECFETLNR